MLEQALDLFPLPIQSPGIVALIAMALAGVCLYAAFDYLIQTGSKPQDGTQALLTVIAFLLAGWAMSGLASYKADSVAVHAVTIKWALAFSILCQVLFPWFVAFFTGRRPQILLAALTLTYTVVLVVHLASPYGLFFSDIKALLVVNLPWGEAIVQPSVTFSPWRWVILIPSLVAFLYACYASVREYRDGKHRRGWLLGLTSIGVYTASIHDMLILESVYVAPYGLLGTVLALVVFRYRLFQGMVTAAVAPRAIGINVPVPEAPAAFDSSGDAPSDPRRSYSPLLGTAAGVLVIIAARMATPSAFQDIAVLLTALAIMVPSIRDAYHVGSARIVRRTAVVALCICVFAQFYGMARHFPSLKIIPFFNDDLPWRDELRDLLFITGILLLFNAFRLAALEAGEVRRRLLLGNDRLTAEVAERRKAEESLRESEQKFRGIFDQAFQLTHMLARDGTLLASNDTALQFAGVSSDAVLGKPFWLTPWWAQSPEQQTRLREAIQRAADGRLDRFETTHRDKEGRLHTVDFSLKPLKDECGRVASLIAEGRDISPLKEAEEELRRSETRFRALIENGSDVIVVLNADLAIRYASLSVRHVLGYEPEEMMGRSVYDFLHPDARAKADTAFAEMFSRPNPMRRVELSVQHNDGSWRILEGAGRNMLDDPVLQGIIVNARDITERRNAEERLQHIRLEERERIRHDLHDSVGQDLTGLLCMTGSLAKRLRSLSVPEADRAASIEDGIRMAMRDVQAAIKGIAPVEPDPYGLVAALRDLVHRLHDDADVAVHFECPTPVHVADNTVATQLFRIAQEALANALRHAHARTVTVSLSQESTAVTLTVTDDGIGITAPATTHTGIGMRTMRDRAGAIAAVLRIDSRPEAGTCVTCRLPMEVSDPVAQS